MKNESIFDIIVDKVEKNSETMINAASVVSIAFAVLMLVIVSYELFK